MKGVSNFEMSEEDAEKAYKEYLEAVKNRKEQYLEDLKKVYFNLKQGRKVIDIFQAMENAGVNEKGEPRLAISRAGFPNAFFVKGAVGSGSFGNNLNSWNKYLDDKAIEQVALPSKTFPNWKVGEPNKFGNSEILGKVLKTKIPVVPAHLLPKGKLENYYILWEVKDWEELPQIKDPFLLRRLSNNLFVILAEWNLTAIEQAVIRGTK